MQRKSFNTGSTLIKTDTSRFTSGRNPFRLAGDGILPRMDRLQLYGFVACAVGAAALITGLLPQDKMDKVRAFLHTHFSNDRVKADDRAPVRLQLIIFGAFFLFLGLLTSGLIRL